MELRVKLNQKTAIKFLEDSTFPKQEGKICLKNDVIYGRLSHFKSNLGYISIKEAASVFKHVEAEGRRWRPNSM